MDEDERMASWNKDEVPELIEEEEELPKKQQVLNKDIKDLEKESVESIAEKHVPSQTEVLPSSSSLVPFSTHAPLISAAPSGVASNNSTLVSNTTIETDRKTTVLEEPSKNISTIALNQTSVTEDKKPAPLNTTQPVPIKIPIAGDDEEESLDFAALVSRYILKRNQSPPPRFRQWFDYAKKNKCYLDRYASIYRDLAPFMDMSRADFKQRLELLKTAPRVHVIQIKDGKRVSRINHVVIASV